MSDPIPIVGRRRSGTPLPRAGDPLLGRQDPALRPAPRSLTFSSRRRAAAKERGPIYRTRIGAHRRELNALLRLLTRLVAGRTLRELGYR